MTDHDVESTDARSQGDGGDQRLADLQRCASGQKLVIYAILVYLGAYAVRLVPLAMPGGNPDVGVLLLGVTLLAGLGAAVLAIVGLLRVATAFGYSTPMKVIFCLLMFVPLASLLVLLHLNGQATAALREAGYTVGFLGVRGDGPA